MSNKLIILFLLAYTAFLPSFAAPSEGQSIKKKLSIVKENISKEKQKKDNLITELNNINKSIKSVDTKIHNIEKNIIKIKENKKILNKDIQKIKIYIQGVKKRKESSNSILKKIIYDDYSNNSINFIYRILNSRSKDIFLDIAFSKYVSKSQNNKLDLYEIDENIKNAMLKKYYEKINILNDQNKNLDIKLSELTKLEKTNILLSKKIKERIKDSKEIYLKYINKESNLTKILKKLNAKNTSIGILKIKGTLPWPTAGRVSRNFNNFKFKNLYKWNGEVISTPSSKSIRSIYSGKVVFSDWIKGYGLMLIIDHGEKIMSIYANNKVLLKKSGDYVEKGDVIARSGSSGGKEGNSIYFEIRQDGVPQNPHEWCSIKNKFSLAQ